MSHVNGLEKIDIIHTVRTKWAWL